MKPNILLLTSFSLMAMPFISLIAKPAYSASLYEQQKLLPELESSSNISHPILISSWYEQDSNYSREYRPNISQERREDHDWKQNQDQRDRNFNQDQRDRNFNQYQRDRNFKEENRERSHSKY